MFGHRIKLLNLLGFQIYIDLSWVIIAVLVTWSLGAGTFPYYYPQLPTWEHWVMGLAGAFALFASIVVHEFCHSIVARRFGLPMKSITLFLFGGVAEMEEQPRSAGVEFAMAIAGPLASVVLGVIFVLLRNATNGIWPLGVTGVFAYLGVVNLILAAFNLLPAFPLDGGRVLRALLWKWGGNIRTATRISSLIGSGFGWFFVGLGAFSVLRGNFIGGIWLALIGLFLRSVSARSYSALLVKQALESERVARFADPNGIVISPSLPVDAFVGDIVVRQRGRLFPVVTEGKLIGCVSAEEVRHTPRESWARRRVGEIARLCTVREMVSGDIDAAEALEDMRRSGSNRLFVVEGDRRFIGTVTLEALARYVTRRLRSDAGEVDEEVPGADGGGPQDVDRARRERESA